MCSLLRPPHSLHPPTHPLHPFLISPHQMKAAVWVVETWVCSDEQTQETL